MKPIPHYEPTPEELRRLWEGEGTRAPAQFPAPRFSFPRPGSVSRAPVAAFGKKGLPK